MYARLRKPRPHCILKLTFTMLQRGRSWDCNGFPSACRSLASQCLLLNSFPVNSCLHPDMPHHCTPCRGTETSSQDSLLTAVECWPDAASMPVQVLDRFLTSSSNGGPFLLGEGYSIAEVNAAPFLRNGNLLLGKYRDYDIIKQAESAGAKRFAQWAQVSAVRDCCDLEEGPSQTSLRPLHLMVLMLGKTHNHLHHAHDSAAWMAICLKDPPVSAPGFMAFHTLCARAEFGACSCAN